MTGHAPLPGVFGSISPLIDHHGYLAIGGVVLLANIGLPAPAEAAVVTGAVFASNGHLHLLTIAVIAALTATIGSLVGYYIGARAGHPLLVQRGARIGITTERLARAESFYQRRGVLLVLVARFLPILRRWNGLTAGVSEMPLVGFAAANVIGAIGWSIAWVEIGNQAGNHLTTISRFLGARSAVIAGAVIVVLLIGLVIYRQRRIASQPSIEEEL